MNIRSRGHGLKNHRMDGLNMKKHLIALTFIVLGATSADAQQVQKPSIDKVAGPTTSAQLRGILSDESGTGVFLTTNGNGSALTGVPAATAIPGTTKLTGPALNTNGLLYNSGGVLTNLPTANSGMLMTSMGGVPSISNVPSLAVGNSTTDGLTLTSSASRTSGDQLYGLTLNTSALGGGLHIAQDFTGTSTSLSLPFIGNFIKINSDNVNGGGGTVTGTGHDMYFGGSAAQGARAGFISSLYQTAPTSVSNPNRNYTAIAGVVTAQSGDNGSGTGVSTSAGAYFGGGLVAVATNGATNLFNVTGAEFNVAMQTGSSVARKSLAQFSNRDDDRVQGTGVDAMLWLYRQAAAAPRWKHGLLFGDPDSLTPFPFDTNSTVMATQPGVIGYGIDFSATTVTNAAFKSPGFSVNGTGEITGANLTISAASGTYAAGALCYSDANFGCLARPRVAGSNFSYAWKKSDDSAYLLTMTNAGVVSVPGSLTTAGQITSTLSTGTAPFVVSSTTNVANLNASSLGGATFAAPGAIGSGTPSTGAFTTLTTPLLTLTGSATTTDGNYFYTPFNGGTNTGTVRAGVQFDGTNQAINFYTADTLRGSVNSSGVLAWSGSASFGGSLKVLSSNQGAFAGGEWSRDASWGTFYKAPATGATGDLGLFDNLGFNGILTSANGTVLTYGAAGRNNGLVMSGTTGVVNVTQGLQASGSSGLSTTKTVRDAAGTGTCTLVFTMGLLTGGTC
jgi:hypothetical protein